MDQKNNSIKRKKSSFNGLTPREWTLLSRNVWDDVSSQRESYHKEHGATFPLALAERVIKIYSKSGDIVFDPFAGVGTTVIGAIAQGRIGVGIELNKRFSEIANDLLKKNKKTAKDSRSKIHLDDCRNLKKYLKKNSVQLTFTSPPYANFIQRSVIDREKAHKTSLIKYNNNSTVKQYSEEENDFGNLDYQRFLNEIKIILKDNLFITKEGGYSVWVVKDYRDTKNKIPYIDFHSDLAKIGIEAGWLYQDLIVWNQNAQRSLVLLGYPSVFYSNQNCSFIVVFRKPLS